MYEKNRKLRKTTVFPNSYSIFCRRGWAEDPRDAAVGPGRSPFTGTSRPPQALSLTREGRASVLLSWGAFAPQGTSNDDRGQGHAVGEAGVLPATLQAPGQPQTPTVPGQRDPGLGHPTALPVREHAGFRFKSPIVPRLSLPSAVAFLTRGGTPCP